jgi:uncharacterized protein YndB with AHSA1/START domain
MSRPSTTNYTPSAAKCVTFESPANELPLVPVVEA